MSGAVTSSTRLAVAAADTSARTSSVARSPGGSVRSRGTHAPTESRATRAAGREARPVCSMRGYGPTVIAADPTAPWNVA